jgi:putative ABC transport system substrate-binding protein
MRANSYQHFIAGLRDLGYEEGRNIAFEFRSAEGHSERFPDIAAELADLKPRQGNIPRSQSAKRAMS